MNDNRLDNSYFSEEIIALQRALESQDIRQVKRFLDEGVDLNQWIRVRNFQKCTLLIYYCHFVNIHPRAKNAIMTLITFRQHLDLDITKDEGSLSALDWAAKMEQYRIVHLLLQAGAGTNYSLRLPRDSRIQKMLLAAGASPLKLTFIQIHPETKTAAQKWLQSLECAETELLKILNDNKMLVQEVKDFIYTEEFLKEVIRG